MDPRLVQLGERIAHVVGQVLERWRCLVAQHHPLDAYEVGQLVPDRPAGTGRGQVPLGRAETLARDRQ